MLFKREIVISCEDILNNDKRRTLERTDRSYRALRELLPLVEEIVAKRATKRQKQIWDLMKIQKTQEEMAAILLIAQPTICFHSRRLRNEIRRCVMETHKGQRLLREIGEIKTE